MAGVNIPIRWSDNTPDLVRNLKEGTGAIEATRAGVEKLAQSLGGDKLIAAAHKMVAAIQEIGGAEKLTNAERERTNALLDKALQKYAALGKQAPTAMRQLNEEMKKMSPPTESFGSALGKVSGLLGAFGVSLSVGALVGFTKTVMADADALVRLSDKTDVSIEWLQKFQIVTDDTGDSLESLAGAVNKLQKNIGNNDPAAIEAIQKLGLSYEHIKTLKPEDQFIAIAGALRNVKDQNEQVAIGTAIMGRGFTEILPTIKAGFDGVKDAAVGMSEETARALDKIGDDAAALWRRLKGQAATALVDVIRFNDYINRTHDPTTDAQRVGKQLELMNPAALKTNPLQGVGQISTPVLPSALLRDSDAGDVIFGLQAENYKKAMAAAAAYQSRLEAVNDKIREATRDIGKLTDSQQAQAVSLHDLGLSYADIAIKLGVSEIAVKRFLDTHDDLERAIDRVSDHVSARYIPAFDGLLLTWAQMLNTGKGLTFDGLIPMVKGFDDASRATLALKLYTDQLAASHAALQTQLAKTIGLMPDLSTLAREHMKELGIESGHGFSDAFSDALDDLPAVMQRAFEGGGGLEGAVKSLGTKLANDLTKSFATQMSASGTPLTAGQSRAIGIGTTGAAAAGGALGGAAGATIGGLASGIGGAALAASAAGTAMAAAGVGGAVALGAATAGIGLAAVGVYMLAKHYLTVSENEKKARVEFAKLQDIYGTLPATIAAVGAAYERMGHTGAEAEAALRRALDATHESAAAEQAALAPIAAILAADEKQAIQVADAISQMTAVGQQFGGTVPDAFKDAVRQLASMRAVTDDERKALLALTKDVKPNFDQLTATAAKYGVTLAGLGKSFQQANIDGRAKDISADFAALTKAGGDAGGILSGMSDEISSLVNDSRQFGTAIPENMRPLIEELVRAGKLTDEAGGKLEDMAGITFEDTPLDDSIQSLADAIKALTEALSGAGTQLADVSGHLPGPNTFLPEDVPALATGSGGLRDFGGGTLATLHGREAVFTEPQYQQLMGGRFHVPGSAQQAVIEEHYHFSPAISAIDGADVQTVMENKLFPAWLSQLRRGRSRTEAMQVLGI